VPFPDDLDDAWRQTGQLESAVVGWPRDPGPDPIGSDERRQTKGPVVNHRALT